MEINEIFSLGRDRVFRCLTNDAGAAMRAVASSDLREHPHVKYRGWQSGRITANFLGPDIVEVRVRYQWVPGGVK